MTTEEAMLAGVDALNASGIPYMLVGSFSSNYYGVPRSTQDADFVIQLGDRPISLIRDGLAPELVLDPQLSFETITATTRHVIRVAGCPFKVELFLLSDDAHDQQRFARRVKTRLFGRDVYLPTAEDVIITKLRWSNRGGRQKDLDDASKVLAVQQDRLDWAYVERWCREHGTLDLLERLRSEIPPL